MLGKFGKQLYKILSAFLAELRKPWTLQRPLRCDLLGENKTMLEKIFTINILLISIWFSYRHPDLPYGWS